MMCYVVLCLALLRGDVLRCVALCCVVLCRVVLKALLPQGNGRDVYPRVRVNRRVVCMARALCVSLWFSAERGGVGKTWMSPTRRMLSS